MDRVVARKPGRGQGELDRAIRDLAREERKPDGEPHLGKIARELEQRHGVRLPTAVVRTWRDLAPGPDYVLEYEVRAAARAARRPRPPVAPEVRSVRRTLRLVPGCSLALVEVVHAEVPRFMRAPAYNGRMTGRERYLPTGNPGSALLRVVWRSFLHRSVALTAHSSSLVLQLRAGLPFASVADHAVLRLQGRLLPQADSYRIDRRLVPYRTWLMSFQMIPSKIRCISSLSAFATAT